MPSRCYSFHVFVASIEIDAVHLTFKPLNGCFAIIFELAQVCPPVYMCVKPFVCGYRVGKNKREREIANERGK